MTLQKLKKHRTHSRFLDGVFQKNPVLICGLALPFAIMITSNLKNGAAISALMACSLVPTVMLASLVGEHLPVWGANILYALFSMALIISAVPLVQLISPETADGLGIYIPILSVNSMLFSQCAAASKPNASPLRSLADAVFGSVGFALALCLISALRELFGNNSIWGQPVALPIKMAGMQFAFSGFLIIAFLGALFRFLRRGVLYAYYRHENPAPEREVTGP